MPPTPAFTTGHIGLNVTDLARSASFYRDVFGFTVIQQSDAPRRAYVFLGYGSDIVLTLWQQSSGAFNGERAGLHHVSFRVGSADTVRAVEQQLRRLRAKIYHGGVVPHNEESSSGGIFFEDPDGIRLEVFAASGAAERPAPTPGAPTCGFF